MTRQPPTTEIRIVLRTILSAGVLAVLVLACAGTAAGAIWVVDEDGGAGVDYMTIQAAVDAASSGDMIEVRSGTYVENVEEVKFRGVVTGAPDFGGAVEAGGDNVQIDKILSDPTGNLKIGDMTTVAWHMVPRFADINVTMGDKVEVCGEYRDIGEIPDWWSDVGDQWVSLNTSQQFYHYLKSLENEIRFTGTAIEYIDMNIGGMVGAPWGWIVRVNDVVSGPQPCNNQLSVTLQAVAPPWGYMDPNITEGDMVEVYGYYYGDQDIRGVSLAGYEEYYIRRLSGPRDRSLIQIEGQPEVYWFQNGRLCWVTDWNVINDMSGVPGWDHVNTLPASEFNPAGYPQGPRFITTGAESDGLLIREQGHPEVYLIFGGEKHHFISPEALLENGYSFDDVVDVSAQIITMFPSGYDISTNPVHNINKSTSYLTIQSAIDDASIGDEIHVDSGTYYENVVMNKQLTLLGINTGAGMPVVDAGGGGSAITLSADAITLEGFTATNSGGFRAGIKVISNSNTLMNNTANSNSYGIHLRCSSSNTLTNNTANFNANGIYMSDSNDNVFHGNTVHSNTRGIYLSFSNNNTLYGNTVVHSNRDMGVYLYRSDGNTLRSNIIHSNKYGINLHYSNNNTLSSNTLHSSYYDDIHIDLSSSSNTIYHNNLIDACDDVCTNQWDSGSEGNHYGNKYIGTDSDGDGIGDTPYPIPGGSSVDRYPLMAPYSPTGYSVGQGAPDLATKNHFIDAYNRNGGATVLGSPTTYVHRAWGYLVQDFPGASGYAGGIIMYNPYNNYAYYIHGAIWERYYGLGGPRAKIDIKFELGPPTSDIKPYIHILPPEVSSHGTQFRYQHFEGGALNYNIDTGEVFEIHGAIFAKWGALDYASDELGLVMSDEREAAQSTIGTEGRVSDFEGGHIHWHRTGGHGGESYETRGAIDAVYCAEGGSGGDLGFPGSDEYVNPSGYPQSDFEGGYITTTDGVNYYVYMNDDTEGPVLEITSPEDGLHTDEYRIDISGTASDDSGILDDEVWIMVVSDGLDYCPVYAAPYNPTARTWSVTNVPVGCGDNEITVWTWDNKHNRVEKTISVYCNPPDFSFAHITDAHIDDDCKPKMMDQIPYMPYIYCESQEKFGSTLREVNSKKPAFVLDTGDCVEYDNRELFRAYMETLDIYIDEDIGIYHTSGNHDRRTGSFPYPATDLINYAEIVKHRESVGSPVTAFEDGYDDYYFESGGYLFIGLESGEDYSHWEEPPFTPEGYGLKESQITKLREMDQNIPKIIFMHHPAINEGDDTSGNPLVLNFCPPEYGGNDECIAFNRCEFIKYCTDYNVQLVLTGHTHKPYYVTVSNTRFIQTPSATKDKKGQWGIVPLDVVISKPGYTMIDVKHEKVYPQFCTTTGVPPKFRGIIACPAHLHAYDSQGRHTGLNASGGVETNIPDSFYIGRYNYSDPNETEMILLYNTTEEYRFEIVANLTEEEKASPEIESFNFTVEQQTGDTRTTIAHLSVPLIENTTATIPINLTTTAYTMEIDYDGDGATDETEDPDSTVTNYVPTAAIIAPETGSIYNVRAPVEFNGTGRDPEDGILTNFSLVWYSDINGVIGAGERFGTANLSCGAHRITLMVNDSVGLTSTSHVTLTIIDDRTPGDLNNDQLTPVDTAIALRMAVRGEYADAADVSRDGRVTSLDALMILQAAGRAIEL